MNSFGGFADLRHHGQSQSSYSDDSVWPSFTDIMTVIVMIFLMALVVILIRNVELVQQLRATMDAEREAAEIARNTQIQKETLIERLNELESTVSMQRLNLLRSEEERNRFSLSLKERGDKLSALQTNLSTLQEAQNKLRQQNVALIAEKSILSERLKSEKNNQETLQRQKASLEQRVNQAATELTALQKNYSEQEKQLRTEREKAISESLKLSALRGDHSTLKAKYDRLVRPARSAVGRYVVEIRYFRDNDKYVIQMKGPDEKQYQKVSREVLHTRLAALKVKDPKRLYTRIIIPENSGLSYNSAWTFTNEVLSRYDYYYQ